MNFLEEFKSEMTFEPSQWIDRDLSWIDFNARVLYQSMRDDVDNSNRQIFQGICSRNLDEFIRVRMDDDSESGNPSQTSSYSSEELVKGLYHDSAKINDLKVNTTIKFRNQLEKVVLDTMNKSESHIQIVSIVDVTTKYLNKRQIDELMSHLTPIAYEGYKEFPIITSGQKNIIASVYDPKTMLEVMCIIPIHDNIPQLIKVEPDNLFDNRYLLVEDVIMDNLHRLFKGRRILESRAFRILRSAGDSVDTGNDIPIRTSVEEMLYSRVRSQVAMMYVSGTKMSRLIKFLKKEFNITKRRVIFTRFVDLDFLSHNNLEFRLKNGDKFEPQYPVELLGHDDIFSAIKENNFVVHHPFETFDVVINFIRQAANDSNTLVIRQTLYRVSSIDSPIVNALCDAAERGVQVYVLLELKARFDEKQNLDLVSKLSKSGCQLVYGVRGYKTHCKFITVLKKNDTKYEYYSHIGTGNYNEKTSKFYTDISYFTNSKKIATELISLFNVMSGYSDIHQNFTKIVTSPIGIRDFLYSKIDKAIRMSMGGLGPTLTFKVNSLSDRGLVKKLYQAAVQGVTIRVIVRSVNSMANIKDGIRIRSVVGGKLEHSRVFTFQNDKETEVYIGSCDLLTRNLDHRFELMVPVTNKLAKQKVLDILDLYEKDTQNTFILNDKNEWVTCVGDEFDVHQELAEKAVRDFKLRSMPKINL